MMLGGSVSIGGLTFVNPGGILAPGGSTGLSTAALDLSNLTINSASMVELQIAGSQPGTEYDQVLVTGTADLGGGQLAITLV